MLYKLHKRFPLESHLTGKSHRVRFHEGIISGTVTASGVKTARCIRGSEWHSGPVINVPRYISSHIWHRYRRNSSTWNCQVQNTGSANWSLTVRIPGESLFQQLLSHRLPSLQAVRQYSFYLYSCNRRRLTTQVSINSNDPI